MDLTSLFPDPSGPTGRFQGFGVQDPHGGPPKIRWGRNLGCYVTNFAPNKALKFIARGKLTFDERVVIHRVAGVTPTLCSNPTTSPHRRSKSSFPVALICTTSRRIPASARKIKDLKQVIRSCYEDWWKLANLRQGSGFAATYQRLAFVSPELPDEISTGIYRNGSDVYHTGVPRS